MLKLNKDQQVLPPGGHQFLSHGFTFTDEKFKELCDKIKDFRITNMIPVGDIEQEVLRYYLDKWPGMVKAAEPAEETKSSEFFHLWARWVGRTWRNPPKAIVTTKEAADRIEICRKCPMNKPFDWKKSTESEALLQRTFLLRKGYEHTAGCGFCSLHKADVSVFCFVATPDAFSEIESQVEPQASCWVGSLKGP